MNKLIGSSLALLSICLFVGLSVGFIAAAVHANFSSAYAVETLRLIYSLAAGVSSGIAAVTAIYKSYE